MKTRMFTPCSPYNDASPDALNRALSLFTTANFNAFLYARQKPIFHPFFNRKLLDFLTTNERVTFDNQPRPRVA